MTVATSTNKVTYDGNGVTTEFSFSFKAFEEENIKAVIIDDEGVETELTLDTDYSVSLNEDLIGGSVTYPLSGDNLPTGSTITVYRELDIKQEDDLHNQGSLSLEQLERNLDKQIMISQQIAEKANRAFKADITADDDGDAVAAIADYIDQAEASASAASSSESNAASSESNAAASEAKAEQWAEEDEDTEVETDKYSAKHHAAKAEEYANQIVVNNQEFTATASQDTFTTTYTLPALLKNTNVYVDGVRQAISTLTRVDDNNIQIGSACSGGEVVEVVSAINADPGDSVEAARLDAEASAGEAETAQTAAETAQGLAEDAQAAAEAAQGLSETAQGNAEAAEAKAEKWAEEVEDTEVEAGKYSALHHAAKAEDEKDKAHLWAEEDEDVEVETGEYSAKHHAAKAALNSVGVSVDAIDTFANLSTYDSEAQGYAVFTYDDDSIHIRSSATPGEWYRSGFSKGPKGDTGDTGPTGADGADGTDGTDGSTWYSGTSNPTTQGVDGDYYLNTSSNDVFKKVSGTWGTAIMNIKGDTGATGPSGSFEDAKLAAIIFG